MTERSPEFIRSVEKLGQYSEDEAAEEAAALKSKITSGETQDLYEAEQLVAKEKIEQLLTAEKALEAVRLFYPVRTPPTLSAVEIVIVDGSIMLPSAGREAPVLTGFTLPKRIPMMNLSWVFLSVCARS